MDAVNQRPQHLLQAILVLGGAGADGPRFRSALLDYAEDVLWTEDADAVLQQVRQNAVQLVVVREDVPGPQALRLVRELAAAAPDCRVVVAAHRGSVEHAVEFVKAGARDYVPGPLDVNGLCELVDRQREEMAQAFGGRDRYFCEACPRDVAIVGRSPAIRGLLETIRLVAESRCNPVLLLGETGTGKELAAQAVHAWRCGQEAPFVAVNCAALTANLLESELFGHVRGAFTGADRDKTGLFELAGSGTIFLDEVSEMPLELQAKLLRVLQERTYRRVGGTKDLVCDATVVVSSNRDLLAEVKAGRFRKDLYYRLAVFPITLEPLRSEDRRSDIPVLAAYFAETSTIRPRSDVAGLTPAAEQKLLAHDWPGNVRELRNIIDRALILEPSGRITPAGLVLDPHGTPAPVPVAGDAVRPNSPEDFSLETAEREFIMRALKETGWQRTRAAALLGITRATLHAKLKRYDIQPPDSDADVGVPEFQGAATA